MQAHSTVKSIGDFSTVPVVDIAPLVTGKLGKREVAEELGRACREVGFFYIVGHGVDEELQFRLEHLSREFFALGVETKMRIRMALAGRAWRGYFPVGGELTSGKPDQKEGLYFGQELGDDHPLVRAGTPIHGRNLFPELPGFRETVLQYLEALTSVGHAVMRGLALSLGLEESYFAVHYTGDPLFLFRIFNYPYSPPRDAVTGESDVRWGVGEHTDYGLLTILRQDDAGGLQVKSRRGWVDAPPIPNSFVCNIGDMLDRMTRGQFRSTPHRVLNTSRRDRLSFPFFFDPNFNAEVRPIAELEATIPPEDRTERWDQASVHDVQGTYGDYLLKKVSKVFPELHREVV